MFSCSSITLLLTSVLIQSGNIISKTYYGKYSTYVCWHIYLYFSINNRWIFLLTIFGNQSFSANENDLLICSLKLVLLNFKTISTFMKIIISCHLIFDLQSVTI